MDGKGRKQTNVLLFEGGMVFRVSRSNDERAKAENSHHRLANSIPFHCGEAHHCQINTRINEDQHEREHLADRT